MRLAAGLLLLLAACAGDPPARGRLGPRPEERLPAAQRVKIAESSVPVLLPRGLDLSASALVVEPMFTALHAPAPGVTVSLHASRMAHTYPGVTAAPGARTLRGLPGFVTRNENIWTASWVEGGVAYALDLECTTSADARCADETHLLELVEELDVVTP